MPKIKYSKNNGNLKKINAKKIKYTLFIIAALYLIFNGNIASIILNTLEIKRLKKENIELDKEFVRLNKELAQLENADIEYIEKIARTQHHLAKPNETEFRFDVKK